MLNQKLRTARILKCWSMERASEMVGVSKSTYLRWETGHQKPHPTTLDLLCQAFEMSPEELGFPLPLSQEEPERREREPDSVVPSSTAHETVPSVVLYAKEHIQSSASEVLAKTPVSSFTLRQQLIQRLVAEWHGRAMYCDELQMLVDQELQMFDLVKSLYHEETYTLSRRSVLSSLATLPLALLSPIPSLQKVPPHPEELLPACAASITSCWSLLNGDGLTTVEQTVPMYLPTLVKWARQTSRYQRVAATLGAQGGRLMGIIAYHHCCFQDGLAFANQAVELARLSGDSNLLAHALLGTSWAHDWCQQPRLMLQKSQEAVQLLPEVLSPLQSNIFARLGYAYAQNNMREEALHSVAEARTHFPTTFGEVPCYVSADYDLSALIIFEGETYFALGENDTDHASEYYKQASEALGQIQTILPGTVLPERNRVQITNYQAQAAIGMGNLEEAEHYLIAGMQGAIALGSEKRRQEVLANWQRAQNRWPQERKVLTMADLLHP
jgi:transcriptional regulator with XRE-family HTH domain/tetratricopeptide (TPR) repeat protein